MIAYDPHDWYSHLFDIKGSMLREIVVRVATSVMWSAVVVLAYKSGAHVAIPSTAHTLVGLALGLLLVFRTNASYDRFWEGRKLWGSIVNESRNIARGARAMIGVDSAVTLPLVRWAAAFPYAAMNELRGVAGLGPVAGRLPPEEVMAALAAQKTTMYAAGRMTALLVEARDRGLISDYLLATLDQNVQLLIDYLGGCERIHKTPLPFAYVVHLRRALILYCTTLPFALVGDFGWGTIVATLLIAYVFFGIEEIGVEIEDPFGVDDNDLPLEALCATIEGNVLAHAGEIDDGALPAAAAG